jgi:hypothetical protein
MGSWVRSPPRSPSKTRGYGRFVAPLLPRKRLGEAPGKQFTELPVFRLATPNAVATTSLGESRVLTLVIDQPDWRSHEENAPVTRGRAMAGRLAAVYVPMIHRTNATAAIRPMQARMKPPRRSSVIVDPWLSRQAAPSKPVKAIRPHASRFRLYLNDRRAM